MKPSEQHLSEPRPQRVETILARHVDELFQRLPMLAGLWLQPDLEVAELTVSTCGYTDRRDLHEEVMQWFLDLANRRPEALTPLMA